MILPSLKPGFFRCQIRLPKAQSFPTSPCRRSTGNFHDAFTEHYLPQPILSNDAEQEPDERKQQANPHTKRSLNNKHHDRHRSKKYDPTGTAPIAGSIQNTSARGAHGGQSYASNSAQGMHQDRNHATSAAHATHQTGGDTPNLTSPDDAQGKSIADAKERILEAMRINDPQNLLTKFWEGTRDPAVMAALPPTTFSEILRQLDPRESFVTFFREYKHWHPKHYWMMLDLDRQFYKALEDCKSLYRDIWYNRLHVIGDMGLREYQGLLRLACNSWDGEWALSIMKEMRRRKVQPDLTCYNLYFEARCWSDAWNPRERQLLRVIPFNHDIRRKYPTRTGFDMTIKGHRIGPSGLKAEISNQFTQMVKEGFMADTATYCHLITALAREGDMEGVKSVLRNVWNVDVDAISEADNECQKESLVPKGSPIYPNAALIFILAHVFGSNNDVPTAIRTIGEFSRRFEVRIPDVAWGELLQWAFVLSARGHHDKDGAQLQPGKLPLQSVLNVWQVMTAKPYCIRPKIEMYDLIIRVTWRRSQLTPMLRYISEGIKVAKDHVRQYRNHANMVTYLKNKRLHGADEKDIKFHERRAMLARRKRFQSFVTVQKWFSLLLSRRQWFPSERYRLVAWERQGLPNAVKACWDYSKSNGIKYTMATGVIRLRESRETSKPKMISNCEKSV